MGNTLNTMLCDMKSDVLETKKQTYSVEHSQSVPMKYPPYYRGIHRPFIH
jgi:hypothetical protein